MSEAPIRGITYYPATDAGNAEWIAALFGQRLRYNHRRACWLVWNGTCWCRDVDGEVVRLAKRAARRRSKVAANISDEEAREKQSRWALQSESRHRLHAALELAKSTPPIADSGEGWDANPYLLSVANGVVELDTGKLRSAMPDDRITLHCASVSYNPAAGCPRFIKFLDEVFLGDADLIRYVQKAVGYSLTGDVSEHCLFFCHGEGANGKSTFLEAIRGVFGDYAHNLPFSSFDTSARSSIPNDIAGLVSKRFVTASETAENTTLNEARVKMLTGGDVTSARFLYHEPFTFRSTAKFWLAFNHKPRITDDSHGFWRRVRKIPFDARFDGVSQDKKLLETLRGEADGILAWAVEGCRLWRQEGLGVPAAITRATDAYRAENNSVTTFLEDCFESGPSYAVTASDLREVYEKWARDNGETPLDPKALAQRLRARGFIYDRVTVAGARSRGWRGLRLKPDSESAVLEPLDTRTAADTRIQ